MTRGLDSSAIPPDDDAPYSTALLATVHRLGAATVHEGAGRIGSLPSRIKPVIPAMRLAGPAFTVHVPPGDNLWIHRAIYRARPGDILVVSTSGGVEFGYWGDILNEAAIARGLGGLVIDGGVRDAARLAEMPLAVFSSGICLRGTIKGYGAQAWTGQPIWVGDVVVRQNDLVVGDADGVVVIPNQKVEEAIAASENREMDEVEKVRRIRSGERTVDIYKFGM